MPTMLKFWFEDETALTEEAMALCGSNFCPANTDKGSLLLLNQSYKGNQSDRREELGVASNFETDMSKIYLMATIYLACSLAAAALLAAFLDPLPKYPHQVISQSNLQPEITLI